MSFTDQIAGLKPAAVTCLFLLIFLGGGALLQMFPLGSAEWLVIYTITMAVMLPMILAWHYSIYRAASDRSESFVGHRGRRAFLFVTCLAGSVVFLGSNQISSAHITAVTPIAMFVTCFSYFAAIWASANALTRFDEQSKSVETHKTLGSFFLQMYFPIGIWFIHRRIKRMLAGPLPERIVP